LKILAANGGKSSIRGEDVFWCRPPTPPQETANALAFVFNILCMADYIAQVTRLCNILCVIFAFHRRIRPPFRHILSSLFKEICEQVLREKSTKRASCLFQGESYESQNAGAV
jgi:hypothetical protein